MDLLPDLNDLNIVPLNEIDEGSQMETEELSERVSQPDEVIEVDKHEDIFATKKKKHLETIRAKSIVARHGTKEQRAEKKRLKEEEKERKKIAKAQKRELKKEENRKKARERYWNKKAEAELESKEKIAREPLIQVTQPPPQPPPQPQPHPQPPRQSFSYNQFANYMDAYNSSKQPPPASIQPKIIEKVVYREVVKEPEKPKYPALFNLLDF